MDACEVPTGYPCKENFPGQPFANGGKPSASASHDSRNDDFRESYKFREFAAGGVLLGADWVKIRDSRRRQPG